MQVREAKDFLVQRTVEQARIEAVPLSDLEKRMMYFTEGPDAVENPVSLNEEFEKQYDITQYEAKLSKLLGNAYKRLRTERPTSVSEWDRAIETLEEGDHYLLVLWSGSSLGRIPLGSLVRATVRLGVVILVAYGLWFGVKYFLKVTGLTAGTLFVIVIVAGLLASAIKPQAVSSIAQRGLLRLTVFVLKRKDSGGQNT